MLQKVLNALWVVVCLLVLFLDCSPSWIQESPVTAKEILDKVDDTLAVLVSIRYHLVSSFYQHQTHNGRIVLCYL
jgi:hypothetical protein